jgi:hypothetical protein
VARWCVRAKIKTAGGVFEVREDEPEPRVGAGCTVPHERWCVSDRLRSRRQDTDLARIVPLFHNLTWRYARQQTIFDEQRYILLTIGIYDLSWGM